MPDVPPLGQESPEKTHNAREAAELRLLEAGAVRLELANKEQLQKIDLRYAAIAAGGIVIAFMMIVIVWLLCKTFDAPMRFVNPLVGVAMIVAPIVSITAIVIAILVGAFRRFDEKDLENVAAVSTGAAGFASNGMR